MSEIRSNGVKSPIPGRTPSSLYCHVQSASRLSAARPRYTFSGSCAIVSHSNLTAAEIAGIPIAVVSVTLMPARLGPPDTSSHVGGRPEAANRFARSSAGTSRRRLSQPTTAGIG
jgi:hypothetical protein